MSGLFWFLYDGLPFSDYSSFFRPVPLYAVRLVLAQATVKQPGQGEGSGCGAEVSAPDPRPFGEVESSI